MRFLLLLMWGVGLVDLGKRIYRCAKVFLVVILDRLFCVSYRDWFWMFWNFCCFEKYVGILIEVCVGILSSVISRIIFEYVCEEIRICFVIFFVFSYFSNFNLILVNREFGWKFKVWFILLLCVYWDSGILGIIKGF